MAEIKKAESHRRRGFIVPKVQDRQAARKSSLTIQNKTQNSDYMAIAAQAFSHEYHLKKMIQKKAKDILLNNHLQDI